MNVNCSNVSADDPRACRGIIRAIRYTLPLFLALSLALAPFSVNITNSGVYVEKSEAHAIAPVFAGAAAFLGEMATAAGFASVGEMVATTVGVTAVSTGMCLATEEGVRYGTEASQNLHNLVNAADYPAWDTLSESDQTSWGSRENYDSAKFNSLMAAYGLGDAYDRYQSAWGQGGAGNFSFSNDETNILQTFGDIGQNWMNGAANQLGDIKSLLTNKTVINNYYGVSNYQYVDCTQFSGWPSSYPQGVYVNYSQSAVINATDASGTQHTTMQKWADRPIYWIVARFTDYTKVFPMYWGFSDQQFKYGDTESSAEYDAIIGNGFYYYESGINSSDRYVNIASSNVQITPGFRSNNYTSVRNFLGQILGVLQPFEAQPNVPDYPQEEPDTTINIYFPSEGITDDTTWDQLTEEPVTPVVRPDNVYNPDNLTGSKEWRDETRNNVMPLQNIKFDKLFPFCLMTDVKHLTEKIEETITPGEQSDYLKIKIPMAYASDGEGGSVSEEIELDGAPLRDLLVMVRPFNQILLLFLMVFSLVMFWKSILTGD